MAQEREHGNADGTVSGGAGDTARLRDEIDATRERMSGTLEELQDRLRPQYLVQQAGHAVRESVSVRVRTVAETATGVAGTVAERARSSAHVAAAKAQQQPMLVAAAVGVASWWLVSDDRESRRTRKRRYDRERIHRDHRRRQAWVVPAILAGVAGFAAVTQVLTGGSGASQRGLAAAKARAGDVTMMMRESAHDVGNTVERWLRENPLGVGMAVFALGAIAGLSLPETDAENRTLGTARRSITDSIGQAVDASLPRP